ncbi:MAG: spermidine/putrescine ABC transporter substrate-binding protein [Anaerolineae bacterium]
MTKKQLLISLLLMIALAVTVAACGGAAAPAPAPAEEKAPAQEEAAPAEEAAAEEAPAQESGEAAMSDRCGDPAQLSEEVYMFNWSDYIDEEIFTLFEEECGVKVIQDQFSSNEDMIAKVQAGNSGYDIVVPSDYAVEIMIDQGLLAELDKDNIPNIANMKPETMGMFFDPENKYSLPYQWGTTGLAYNVTAFPDGPPDSWAAIFEPDQVCKNSGFVSMLDDERESIGAALKYLGYSYNDTDPAHQEEAKTLLLGQKDCLAGYNSDNFNQTLAAEEVMLAHAWSGGTALARDENENIAFVIPKEGGAIWQDNLAIPVDAPHKYTAEVFINYLLEADIGAMITNYNYYFTPNAAAEPLLDEYYANLLKEGGMEVTDDIMSRLEWIQRDDKSIIFSDTWTAVKAQ